MSQKWLSKRAFFLRPALLAASLVLFPFDWLGDVWPAYALVFDRVFATALAHEVGHTTLFFIAGLLILLSFPRLRRRPALYLVIMALGAVSEEALQDLFKLSLPSIWDGRDLLLDLTGFVVAYAVMRACSWGRALLEKEERRRA
jgi:hypothetical protein